MAGVACRCNAIASAASVRSDELIDRRRASSFSRTSLFVTRLTLTYGPWGKRE